MSGRLTCCNNNDIIHVHTQVWQDGLIREHCISVTTATLLLHLDVSDLQSPQEAWHHSTTVFVCCAILGNGWKAKKSEKWSQTSAKVYCTIWGQRLEIWQPCNCIVPDNQTHQLQFEIIWGIASESCNLKGKESKQSVFLTLKTLVYHRCKFSASISKVLHPQIFPSK